MNNDKKNRSTDRFQMRATIAILALCLTGSSLASAGNHPGEGAVQTYVRPVERLIVTAAVPRNWPPHYMTDSSGNPDGFAIDAMREIARLANVDVRYTVHSSFTKAMDSLESKKTDLVPNVGIADFRRKYALFTPPVETFLVSAYVRTRSLSKTQLTTNWLEILNGRKTAVVTKNVGKRILAKQPDVPTVEYENIHEAIVDLIAGRVDALVYPQAVVNRIISSVGLSEQIEVAGTPLREIKRGLAIRNDYPELHKRLSLAANQFVKSNKYEEIYTKWFGLEKPFWTTRNLIIYIGIPVAGLLLFLIVWRYVSVMRLNQRLVENRRSLARLNSELESRVEERTRENKLILNAVGEGIYGVDLDGLCTFINPVAEKLLGWDAGQLIGKPQHDLLHHTKLDGTHYPRTECPIYSAFKDGKVHYVDNEVFWRKDGSKFSVEYTSTPIFDDGETSGAVVVFRDITDRKQAEQALKEVHQLNESIFLGSPVGIATYDNTGQCISANQAIGDIVGATREQALAQNYHETDSWRESGLYEKVLECLSIGTPQRHELHTVSSFGKDIYLDCHLVPIVVNAQQHLLLMITDTSENRIIQEQLIQSSKMATLGEMATGIAHELNQPLNVISMAINNIRRKSESNEADPQYLVGKLDKVEKQVERASAIIDHMRIFGRRPGEETQALDPVKMLKGSLNLIGEQLRLSGIEVTLDTPEICRPIRGHQVQFEQVMLNLLSNARDALRDIPTGDKRIDISITEGKNDIRIGIEDTGGGVALESLSRLFEPFYTTKEVGQGTGLGLSISYGIISEMGGSISVENTDTGALFFITLPTCSEKSNAA